MEKLIVSVRCPYCRNSLMDTEKQIDNQPSIKAKIQYREKIGLLHMSSLFGSFNILSEIYVPKDEIVLLFCPECGASLVLKELCEECHAPLAFMELKNGGTVQICSRRGCKYHFLDYTDFAQKLSAFYDTYKTQADPTKRNQDV
jgi:methionyl-tRNA synthetase